MVSDVNTLFDKFYNQETTVEMINFIFEEEECSLITIMMDGNIDFVGSISSKDAKAIKKILLQKEYYSVAKGIYKIILDKSIYLFKMFGKEDKTVLIGVLAEKSEGNRLNLLERQSSLLLQKAEAW
jgi:hypothetical protein